MSKKTVPGKRHFPAREARKSDTRQRLLNAAVSCFRSSGYAATTMDDIAHRAGTTRVTVYRHFSGKTDIARQLLSTMSADGAELMARHNRMRAPKKRALVELVRDVRTFYRSHSAAMEALSGALAIDQELVCYYSELVRDLTGAMTDHLSLHPEKERTEQHRQAMLVFLLVERLMFFNTLHATCLSGEEMIESMALAIGRLMFPVTSAAASKA